jgi:geranylgeranyl pyrophosphate synthase
VGALFQLVDDILDGDGFAARYGVDEARRRADETAGAARERLDALPTDTSTLAELVDDVAARA